MAKHTITFHPSGRKTIVDSEVDLLQAAMEAGIHINASCGGSATCGKCKVKILKGAVHAPKHPKLTQWEYDQGYRLACMTPVRGDMEIEIPLESQVDKSVLRIKGDREAHKYLLAPQDIYQLVKGWDVDPAVFKRYVELLPPTLKDNVERPDPAAQRVGPPAWDRRGLCRLQDDHEVEPYPPGGRMEGDGHAGDDQKGL